jgi:hypothetical protein
VNVPTYIVERYWPGVTRDRLAQAIIRSREIIALMNERDARIRYLRSTLVPGDEVVFSLYEGPSAEAIREANERSRFHFDRITEAVDLAAEAWP